MIDDQRPRSAVRRLLVGAAALVLIVVVGHAAAADLPSINFVDPGLDPGRPPPASQSAPPYGTEFDLSDATDPPKQTKGNIGDAWDIVRWVLLGGAVAFVVAVVVRRLMERREPAEVSAEVVPTVPELSVEDADSAFASAQEELHATTDVTEAIINVWLTLERLVARSGLERRPHQTTGEYVVAVLATLHPDERPLQALASLYRRALFDDHRPDETDRTRAHELLAELRDQVAVTHD